MSAAEPLKLCYVLAYYAPDYIRTLTLVAALNQSDQVELLEARNRTAGPLRYWQTLRRLWRVRWRSNPDCYLLGFRGHELYWPVRLITWGKPLIFDQLLSPYDSLLYERRQVEPGGLLARLVYAYERFLLHNAALILTDTGLHQRYFTRLFDLPPEKIQPVPVGADETLFQPAPAPTGSEPFLIFFYGTFLPLHGVEIILEAAARLKSEPIRFLLVGGHNKDLTDFQRRRQALNLPNLSHREWVDYDQLPALIAQANLCLGGPLGDTGQARRVVTGKTFQFLAMGRPTLIGQIEEDYGFRDKENCLLVPQGDPVALAEAIRWAFQHQPQLAAIGQAGRRLYQQQFSSQAIRRQLETILNQL